MSKPIDLVAILTVLPAHIEAAAAAAKLCAEGSRQEPGCLLYLPHVSKEAPSRLIFVERFRDQAAIDEHEKTPHFRAFFAFLEGKLSVPPEIIIIDPVG